MKRTRARGRLSRGVTVNLQGRPGRFRGSAFGGVQITVRWTWGKFCRGVRGAAPAGGIAGGSGPGGLGVTNYCDALTTTDGPCQTSPDLLPSALSAEQWGRSGERGQPPAVAASARAPEPQRSFWPREPARRASGVVQPFGAEPWD